MIADSTQAQAVRAPQFTRARQMLVEVAREHAAFIALVLAHAGIAAALLAGAGRSSHLSLSIYQTVVPWLLVGYAATFLLGYVFWIIYVKRPPRLGEFLRTHLIGDCLHPRRVVPGLLVVAGISIALSVYTSIKSAIPLLVPFHMDQPLAQLDASLHGGRQPWEWLQPVLGSPPVTSAIATCYHLWFVAMYVGIFWQAFSRRDPVLRQQFLLTFVLVWVVLGNVAALLLSSAGPVYYQLVTGHAENPYAPLLSYLHDVDRVRPLLALDLQAKLWTAYQNGGIGFGSGISAMPSIHNAMVWLLAFLCWRTHRLLGVVATLFALLVFLGSVHLAWHYAVDAYVAVLGTWLIWWSVGRWLSMSRSNASGRPAIDAADR